MSQLESDLYRSVYQDPNFNLPSQEILEAGKVAMLDALIMEGHPLQSLSHTHELRAVFRTAIQGFPSERAMGISRLLREPELNRHDVLVYPFVVKRIGGRGTWFVLDRIDHLEGGPIWHGPQTRISENGRGINRLVISGAPGVWRDLLAPNVPEPFCVHPCWDIAYYLTPLPVDFQAP